ncbi:hypothetical protein SVIOM342S_04083 [Streptomyces violaceorubidus]
MDRQTFHRRQDNREPPARYGAFEDAATVPRRGPPVCAAEVVVRSQVKSRSPRSGTVRPATGVLFSIEERGLRGAGDGYDVWDAEGNLVGGFEEKDVASLVRSTWVLDQPGFPAAVGRERNRFVGALRRAWDFLPLDLPFLWPYHFDFETGGKQVLKVDRKWGLRDR